MEIENTALHREIATHEETIENLQAKIQIIQHNYSQHLLDMQQKHRMEMAEKSNKHKNEVSKLKRIIEKLYAWFPMAKEIMRIENLCCLIGFDENQTTTLTNGKPLIYEGRLYSEDTQSEFQYRKGRFPSGERPCGQVKTNSCNQPSANRRMV